MHLIKDENGNLVQHGHEHTEGHTHEHTHADGVTHTHSHSHGDGEHAHTHEGGCADRVTAVPAKAETARKKPSHF